MNTRCHSSRPLFTRPRPGRWEALILPPPVFSGPPSLHHQLLSQLYKLPLFSLLFPPLQSWLSEHGKRGRHAKRCGIFFLSFLAPITNPHEALWPFLHALHTLHLPLGLLCLYEKPRFSADCFLSFFLFFYSGLLTSARCLNKA